MMPKIKPLIPNSKFRIPCLGVGGVLLLICFTVNAQKQFNVLDWKAEYTLNTALLQTMHAQYDERKASFEKAVTSREKLEAYQKDVRNKFIKLLGEFPEKSPLEPMVTGIIDRGSYRIEKVIYQTFFRHRVTANIYIPAGKEHCPAALLFCGHEDASKATESYQKTAILFAMNGFVVLVVDPISQSERYQLADSSGKPLTRGGTTGHTLLNEASNLLGTSVPAYELWDNIRSLDYLVTRKEVDPDRIGCLGNSGGGMQTIYFAGYDPRIKVFAPCSYLATRERTLELSGPADGCAQMPNEGRERLEFADYLIAAAPKPLLILAGRYDFIDYTGTLTAYNELKQVYKVKGATDKLKLFTYDDGHGISKPKREAAVTWFKRWLMNDSTPAHEPELVTLTTQELNATEQGQLVKAYADELTIPKHNLTLFDSLVQGRKVFLAQPKEQIIKNIQTLLNVKNEHRDVEVEQVGTVTKSGILYKKMIVRKQGEVPLPVLVSAPSSQIKKVVLLLYEEGKGRIADSTILMQNYLEQGYFIIVADLRGIGETADKPEMNDAKYYNKEYRNAMLALHIGSSLVGQRTADVLTLLDFINSDKSLANLPLEINASGCIGLSVVYASFFNKKPVTINIFKSIRSFKEILDNPIEKNWYSYVIPGVLKYYDIPDLIQLMPETRVSYVP
ncbi:alpha/beta hydrolase family protein [Chitinophagaceae bacterium LWZ2-11]